MAIHKLNKATDTTWEINVSGDTWILGEKGSITGTDIRGIHAGDMLAASTVRIDGTIDLDGLASRGVYLETEMGDIAVSDTGHVTGYVALYYENGNGTVTIDNAGLLEADFGIAVYGKQALAHITNDGRILADIGINEVGAGATIVNSGVINAATGIIIASGTNDDDPLWADKSTHIVNSGKITGSNYSLQVNAALGVAANIRNTGTLNGDVVLGDGEDVVNTRGGTINGAIDLGSGNDLLDGRNARINGVILGGLGDDTVTLGSAAQVFVEEAGEGIDTVRINATYLLGENIENVTLLGKANHTGIGNVHQNVLTGNKGANTLYGLQGGDTLDGGKGNDLLFGGDDTDTFVFKAGYGKDTIGDFEDGVDHINLEDFGFASFAAVTALITEVGDDYVINLSDTDKLVIRDGAANNVVLDAADFYL